MAVAVGPIRFERAGVGWQKACRPGAGDRPDRRTRAYSASETFCISGWSSGWTSMSNRLLVA